jgi:hypothetical protein
VVAIQALLGCLRPRRARDPASGAFRAKRGTLLLSVSRSRTQRAGPDVGPGLRYAIAPRWRGHRWRWHTAGGEEPRYAVNCALAAHPACLLLADRDGCASDHGPLAVRAELEQGQLVAPSWQMPEDEGLLVVANPAACDHPAMTVDLGSRDCS